MDKQEFLIEYGNAWKKMFVMCVWNVPSMREWLAIHWNAVYEEIATEGIDGTPDLWLMLAHHSAMKHMDEIIPDLKY